ncbi:cupin domain-containing protein [Rothia sp. ARF10]|nr:cupin domain-containing protein [Rothia sp. ARF10]
MRTAEQIIAELNMQPIPDEGAWFVEGPRTQGLSSILVLLTSADDGFSAMHKLGVDEGWQWLEGAPAALLRLKEGPKRNHGTLALLSAQRRQMLVRSGWWQGAATMGEWSLLSCWCSPAFRPRHFTLGDRDDLTSKFPTYAAEIAALTRPDSGAVVEPVALDSRSRARRARS